MALAKHAEEITEKVLENLQKMKQKEIESAREHTPSYLNPRKQTRNYPGIYWR